MKKIKFKFNRFNIIIVCVTFALLLLLISTFFHTYSDYVKKDSSKIEGDTVYINDLASDYYYLLGMNYVGDLKSNTVNYTESNIKMVTVNYYGYPSGDTNQTGYVSLDEKQNKFVYYKYYPVKNNQIEIELIDNPFALRPEGKGFGGWTSTDGTITKDSDTNTYTLTVSADTATVNVYANWVNANIIFLKGENGDDNFDGSSDYYAVASWSRAFELLRNNTTNASDREVNIIVLTGPLDHTINYSRRITHTWNYSYTYHDNTTFNEGEEYIIEYKNGNNRYALNDNWSNVGMESLSTATRPSDKSVWIITHDDNGYLIRNKDSGNYLGYEQYYNDQVAIFVRNTPYYWKYDTNLRTFFTTFQLTYTKFTYLFNDTISNNTYLIADRNSYTNNDNFQRLNIMNNSLSSTAIDSENYNENDLWRINSSGTGYTIMNNNSNTYLNYHSLDGNTRLLLNNTANVWNYDSTNHTLSTEVTHYVTEQQYNVDTITSGSFYLGYQDGNNYALLNNNRSFNNFNTNSLPGNTYVWTFVQNGTGYYIRNSSNQYLRVRNGALSTTTNTNNRTLFYLDNNNRLYNGNYYLYRNGNYLAVTNNGNNATTYLYKISLEDVEVVGSTETMYLRFNNNNWSLSTTMTPIAITSYEKEVTTENRNFYLRYDTGNDNYTFDTSTTGTGLMFATFDEDRTMSGTNRDNLTNNYNYNSSSNSVAITITSMYGDTDYRTDATLTLNGNYRTIVYRDLQLEYLKVSSGGYQAINDSTTTTNLTGSYSSLVGNSNNVRIGRGMTPNSWTDNTSTIFSFMQGGGDATVGSTNNTNNAYKFVVESGRYSGLMASHIRNNYSGTNYYNYYGSIYLTMGNDYDRARGENDLLDVYYRMGSSNYYGVNGRSNAHDLAYLIDIKSGTIGMNYFNNTTEDDETRAYSGIYVGGLTVSANSSNDDISSRVLVVEGGDIANIIGGLRLQESSGNKGVNTKIYVKNGSVQNIVGGAGVSTTYGDRYISVTGGKIGYSISGGSNGIAASNDTDQSGRLGGDSYVHVGGEAHIGTASGTSLYEVKKGSVLGAGNGNIDYQTSGRVDTSHVYISGDATIEGNVYGGGNFGPVLVDSNITIDGATIKGNVYGGANKNGVGTVVINESTIYNVNYKDDQELTSGTTYLISKTNGNNRNLLSENNSDNIYNVSMSSGNQPSDYSRWIINSVTGGYTIRNLNYNHYLAYTTDVNPNLTTSNNTTNAIWNYDTTNKTFYRDISYIASRTVNYTFATNLTSGREYILASGNNLSSTLYYMDSDGDGVRLSRSEEPNDNSIWIITASGNGYTIRNKATNQYLGVSTRWFGDGSLSLNTQTAWTWNAANHQFTYTTSGWFGNTYYLSYDNGFDLSTAASSIYPATFTSVTTSATDRFYLVYDNAWKLSKTVSSISLSTFTSTSTTGYAVSNRADGDVNITMNNGKINGAIYGGACEKGNIAGSVTINVNGGQIGKDSENNGGIFGGGYGEITFVANGVDLNISDTRNVTVAGTIYGGSALGTIIGDIDVSAIDAVGDGNINITGDFYCGSMGDKDVSTTGNIQGNCSITLDGGTYKGSVFGGNNANGSPTGVVTVTTGGNNTTTINSVYGGGNAADSTATNVVVNIESNSVITNAFGGGNEAMVEDTHINLHGGVVTNIYGGSNQSGNITTSNITTTGGTAINVYGGNNLGGTTTNSNITVNGGSITNLYGGGNEASTGTTNINLNQGTVTNTYGGGNKAGVTTSTTINLSGSTCADIYGGSNTSGDVLESYITATSGRADNIYGGNNIGGVTTTTNVDISNITVGSVYGGGKQATTGTDNVTIRSGRITNVYGGGQSASVNTDTNVDVLGGNITNLFGGSNTSGTVPESHVHVIDGTVETIYGGNNAGGSTNVTNVLVTAGTITNVYGGGNAANSIRTNVILDNSTNTISNIFGGCKEANATETNVTLNNGRATNVFGGSNTSGTITNSHVRVNNGTYTNVYGGNNDGGSTTTTDVKILGGSVNLAFGGGNNAQTGTTNIVVDNATISNILYGGGNNAAVNSDTNVVLGNNATVTNSAFAGGNNGHVYGDTNITVNTRADIGGHLFGGGNAAAVSGNTNLLLDDGIVRGNVYGGGNYGEVSGSTNVNIKNSVIFGSAYAGGNGAEADVLENTTITVQGSSIINHHVFGGGNAADTGTSGSNNSNGLVNITGGNIGGNVYGGANTAVLYGETVLNIGYDAVVDYMNDNNYTKGNIVIGGTVFGGGEANESGSEVYDFDFISVTKGIIINIDGNGHSVYDIKGSIFGSGNASRTTGYSRIYINNYGSESDIKNNVSLQRADLAVLNNSHMALSGATDRTNEYSQVEFSLSRITELNLKNSSEIYLERGANLLTKFKSLKANGDLAEVSIDETTHEVDRKGTNNRLYMLEDKVLNIALNQNVTAYGEVDGMTFFGMFKRDRNGNIVTAMYDTSYTTGSTAREGDLYYFNSGSYVLGLHETNHNIKVDGFYTNYADSNPENHGKVLVDYITPTPENAEHYMWTIGVSVQSYDIEMIASKYSTLGTYEFPFINNSSGNTTFNVVGFSYDEIDPNVSLINPDDIPRVAASGNDADNTMGLAIKPGIGWVNIGSTYFLTDDNNKWDGQGSYKSENSNITPSFVFYLYHSKNLQTEGSMGTAIVSIEIITPIDDLTNHVERVNFNITISRAIFDTDDYEGAMTPGRQYEMFTSSKMDITSKSSLSAYYSLYMENNQNIYRSGYHRVLTSNVILPVNTKITMIDFATASKPEYYYYIVNEADNIALGADFNTNQEIEYPLSNFVRMGSLDTNNKYDDSIANGIYYDSANNRAIEEFIFIVDFKDAEITENMLDCSLLIDMVDNDNNIVHSVLGIQRSNLVYNLFANQEPVIDVSANVSKPTLYAGDTEDLRVTVNFNQNDNMSLNRINDTTYFDQKLGLKISFINERGDQVNGVDLLGTSLTLDGKSYYASSDGTIRFKISDRVANSYSNIRINTDNSTLAAGNYTIKVEAFYSTDGIYFGREPADTATVNFRMMNKSYGLTVDIPYEEIIIDHATGLNIDKTRTINASITYSGSLLEPNIKVALYRRSYATVNNMNYSLVPITDYITNNVTMFGNNSNIYTIIDELSETDSYTFNVGSNLTTGTYKLEFKLYDGSAYVGNIIKYIIIK